jgi:hypothetical protein
VRSLVVISVICCVVLGAPHVYADDKIVLPPVGVWVSQGNQPDFLLDFKGEKTPSAADSTGGKPPVTKEDVRPFIGLSLTRPLDHRN